MSRNSYYHRLCPQADDTKIGHEPRVVSNGRLEQGMYTPHLLLKYREIRGKEPELDVGLIAAKI